MISAIVICGLGMLVGFQAGFGLGLIFGIHIDKFSKKWVDRVFNYFEKKIW